VKNNNINNIVYIIFPVWHKGLLKGKRTQKLIISLLQNIYISELLCAKWTPHTSMQNDYNILTITSNSGKYPVNVNYEIYLTFN
jgi:hypothetical protein